jgi:hypothetical protein
MGYKWKPNKNQRREFAERMQNPVERTMYLERKKAKEEKRRAQSSFDYQSAGGAYIPTKSQYDFIMLHYDLFDEVKNSADMLLTGYTCQMRVPHDDIHQVNEVIRKFNVKNRIL